MYFAVPLKLLRGPLGDHGPQFENHWSSRMPMPVLRAYSTSQNIYWIVMNKTIPPKAFDLYCTKTQCWGLIFQGYGHWVQTCNKAYYSADPEEIQWAVQEHEKNSGMKPPSHTSSFCSSFSIMTNIPIGDIRICELFLTSNRNTFCLKIEKRFLQQNHFLNVLQIKCLVKSHLNTFRFQSFEDSYCQIEVIYIRKQENNLNDSHLSTIYSQFSWDHVQAISFPVVVYDI